MLGAACIFLRWRSGRWNAWKRAPNGDRQRHPELEYPEIVGALASPSAIQLAGKPKAGKQCNFDGLTTLCFLAGTRVIEYALNESLIIDTGRRRRACEILAPFQRRVGIRLDEYQFAGGRKPQIQPSGASDLQ
jgi:hypothetical protein